MLCESPDLDDKFSFVLIVTAGRLRKWSVVSQHGKSFNIILRIL
jgi:hypothetical protein